MNKKENGRFAQKKKRRMEFGDALVLSRIKFDFFNKILLCAIFPFFGTICVKKQLNKSGFISYSLDQTL